MVIIYKLKIIVLAKVAKINTETLNSRWMPRVLQSRIFRLIRKIPEKS
jgi:hypothetical protein